MKKTQLQVVADEFNLGKITSMKKSIIGIVNHNWIITTTTGKYVLRGVPKYRSVADINYEQKSINKKRSNTCPTRVSKNSKNKKR